MTFKPIDYQMSVPRTPEKGGMHAQQLHKPIADQQQLAGNAAKETERLRQMNTEVDEAANETIRDGGAKGSGAEQQGKKNKKQQEQDKPTATHPFKGKHIDISF